MFLIIKFIYTYKVYVHLISNWGSEKVKHNKGRAVPETAFIYRSNKASFLKFLVINYTGMYFQHSTYDRKVEIFSFQKSFVQNICI